MGSASLLFVAGAVSAVGVTQPSDNFVVRAPSAAVAQAAADAAERYRAQLAKEWLGGDLPAWSTPCRVTVAENTGRPSGRTSYTLIDGRVADLRIVVRGPLDRILDSVLPHEMAHAVLATHFGRAIPRWADEGAATLAESRQQQTRQRLLAADLLAGRGEMSLVVLMGVGEYPGGERRMMAVYVQGFSLVDYLVQQRGKRQFIRFLHDATERGWERAVRANYGLASVGVLERRWRTWAARDKRHVPPRKRRKRRWV